MPARLLGIGLPLTIAAGTLVALALLSSLSFAEALVLAIVLAPTDAALGQAVVTDPRLPSRIRQGLNVESGLNDGLCVPLLFIALAIGEAEDGSHSARRAVRLVVGGDRLGRRRRRRRRSPGALAVASRAPRAREAVWLQVIPVASAALAYGVADGLGGSGFIAAFAGGSSSAACTAATAAR